MIHVRCLGHIGTSVGAKEVLLEGSGLDAAEVVERVRNRSNEKNPGFNKYNTIVMLDDGEAFVPAGVSRMIRDGDRLTLLPFSHGG